MKIQKTAGIGEVVRLTGVSEKQLRYWQEAGYIKVERVVCGDRAYRRYTEHDIAMITIIKNKLKEGFNLSNAARIAEEIMEGVTK